MTEKIRCLSKLVLINLTQARVPWEEETSVMELTPLDCPISICGGIVLTDDSYGRPQPTAEGATPGQVVLHYTRKQSEEATESKPISSISP